MNQQRAQLIQDVVQMSETEGWKQKPEEERPRCATCGKPLVARGEQTRFLQTSGVEAVISFLQTYGCPHQITFDRAPRLSWEACRAEIFPRRCVGPCCA